MTDGVVITGELTDGSVTNLPWVLTKLSMIQASTRGGGG